MLLLSETARKGNPAQEQFSISELSQEFDVTTRAIRFYEESISKSPGIFVPNYNFRVMLYFTIHQRATIPSFQLIFLPSL